MTPVLVIMGVSGSGKSTLGLALAARLGWRFIEGDDLHPPANIAKMAAGLPLDDSDRRPFLEAVARAIAAARGDPACAGVVLSCSALKRSYRELLRAQADPITFVLPLLTRAQLVARLALRPGHFMPASLLDSQLATLEPPGPDEAAILIDANATVATQVAAVCATLAARGVPITSKEESP